MWYNNLMNDTWRLVKYFLDNWKLQCSNCTVLCSWKASEKEPQCYPMSGQFMKVQKGHFPGEFPLEFQSISIDILMGICPPQGFHNSNWVQNTHPKSKYFQVDIFLWIFQGTKGLIDVNAFQTCTHIYIFHSNINNLYSVFIIHGIQSRQN